jgi:hypothetical protein
MRRAGSTLFTGMDDIIGLGGIGVVNPFGLGGSDGDGGFVKCKELSTRRNMMLSRRSH